MRYSTKKTALIFLVVGCLSILSCSQESDKSNLTAGSEADATSREFEHPQPRSEVLASVPTMVEASELGYAISTISIDTLPVGNQFSPKIALVYSSSQTEKSLAGIGWSLTGLSVISRCPSQKVFDGVSKTIEWTDSDSYCLDGMKLLLTGGSIAAGEAEFRLYLEEYKKIRFTTGHFEVQHKSGERLYFGSVAASRERGLNGKSYSYHLDKVVDRSGNSMEFSYDRSGERLWPTRISYGGNEYFSKPHYRSLRLSYSSLPGQKKYIAGQRFEGDQLLKGIDAYSDENFVFGYRLHHKYPDSSHQPHLNAVDQCFKDLACTPKTVFDYDYAEGVKLNETGRYIWPEFAPKNNPKWAKNQSARTLVDLNNDGYPDLLALRKDSISFSLSGPNGPGAAVEQIRTDAAMWSPLVDMFSVSDMNRDGFSDIVLFTQYGPNPGVYVAYWTGEGFGEFKRMTTNFGAGWSIRNHIRSVVDVNNDGWLDVIGSKNEGIFVALNDKKGNLIGGGTAVAPYFNLNEGWMSRDAPRYFVDVNGDGYIDVLGLFFTDIRVSLGTGEGFLPPQIWLNDFGSSTYPTATMPRQLADMNGDGLVDLVAFGVSGVDVALNTGTQFEKPERWLNALGLGIGWNNKQNQRFVFDINMDGYPDFVGFKWDGTEIYLGEGQAEPAKQPIRFARFSDLLYPWNTNSDQIEIDDLDGNGKMELLTSLSDGIWKAEFDSNPVRLRSVKTAFGEETRVSYKSLMDPSIYTQTQSAVGDTLSVMGPMLVVSDIHKSNGIGGFFSKHFNYENALYHRDVFGFLGFEKRKLIDDASSTETIETYSQDVKTMTHGTLLAVDIYSTAGRRKLLSSVKSNYTSIPLGGHALHRILVENKNESKFFDEQEQPFYSVASKKKYDAYQNATSVETTVSDAYSVYKTIVSTTYENDDSRWNIGIPLEVQTILSSTSSSDSIRKISRFTYDIDGRLLSETTEPDSPLWIKKVYTRGRNNFGLVDTTVQSWGSGQSQGLGFQEISQYIDYDGEGFVESTRDPMGHRTSSTRYADTGQIHTTSDSNGLVTTYFYDTANRIKSTRFPDGRLSEVERNFCDLTCPSGAILFEKSFSKGFGYTTSYVDSVGRVIKSVRSLTGKHDVVQDNIYDERGLLAKVSKPYFAGESAKYWTSILYDQRNQPNIIKRPDGGIETILRDGLTSTNINALGHKTIYKMDGRGLLRSVTNARNETLKYVYNSAGNLIEIHDNGGNVTKMTYDLYGRRLTLTDPVTGIESTEYNALGAISSSSRAGRIVENTYDVLGRLLSRSLTKPGFSSIVETMVYDKSENGIGLLSSAAGLNGSVTHVYDKFSRLTETTEILLGKKYNSTSRYDELGRLAEIAYPSGFGLIYGYDSVGQLSSIQDLHSKKSFWSLSEVYPGGEVKEYVLGNGARVFKDQNPKNGLLTAESVAGVDNVLQMARRYEHDLGGNLLLRKDAVSGVDESFAYDELDRLTRFPGSGSGPVTMKYDDLGRIIARSDIGTYEYGSGCTGATNSLFALKKAGARNYCMDGSGNIVKSGNQVISYNSSNLPLELRDGQRSVLYAYGLGDSILTKEESDEGGKTLTRFAGNGLYELVESEKGTTQRHYVGDFLIVDFDGAVQKENYLYKDYLGSTLASADQNGVVIERLDYDPFGQRRDVNTLSRLEGFKPKTTSIGFTGHDHIDSMNLIHMKGRVYDPTVGLFLTPDPFVQDPTQLQNLNRYSYVLNNPLKYTDPSGYFFKHAWKELGKGFKSAGKALQKPGSFLERSWNKLSRSVSDPRYQRLAASIAISVYATINCPFKAPEAWAQTAAYYSAVGYTSTYVVRCFSDTRSKSDSLMRYNNSPGGFDDDDDRQTIQTSVHR